MRNNGKNKTEQVYKCEKHFNNALHSLGLRMRHLFLLSFSSTLSPFQLSECCRDFDLSIISQVCRGKPTNLSFFDFLALICLFPRSVLRMPADLVVILAFYQRGEWWSTFHWCCFELDEDRKSEWQHTY